MNRRQFLDIFEKVKREKNFLQTLRELILKIGLTGKLCTLYDGDVDVRTLINVIDEVRCSINKKDCFDYSQLSDEEEWPFQIPSHWQWVHFGRICEFGAGRTPARAETKYWQGGKTNWVSISDMSHGNVLLTTAEKVTDVAKKEVFKAKPLPVRTMIMSFKLTIGKICRLGVPAYTNEAIIWIKPYQEELANFLFMFLPVMAKQGNTKAAVKGATLNRDSISKIKVPLPPLKEQKRIVAKVDEFMALCNELEKAQSEQTKINTAFATSTFKQLANNGHQNKK